MRQDDKDDTAPTSLDPPQLRLGVSACLLGQEVRFDGGHKRDLFLLQTLGRYVTWVPVCPEVELGLGTPRETLRLEGDPQAPRMLMKRSGVDHTDAMKRWSEQRLDQLIEEDLDGYIFKSKSPSCGLFRIKVYALDGNSAERTGRGLFARALTDRWPLLPVEEEGRLNDPHLREGFIEHMFVHHRWKQFLRNDPTPQGLIAFHTSHKMALLARHESSYRSMGPLVATAGTADWHELLDAYSQLLATAMNQVTSRSRTTNVLSHLMGFLKQHIDANDKQELVEHIEYYRLGQVPLIVPLTLLKHHFRRHDVPPWLAQQTFLHPYPKELMLRNQI